MMPSADAPIMQKLATVRVKTVSAYKRSQIVMRSGYRGAVLQSKHEKTHLGRIARKKLLTKSVWKGGKTV